MRPIVVRAAAGSRGRSAGSSTRSIRALVVGGGLGLERSYRAQVEAAMRAEIYDVDARALPMLPAVLHGDAPVIGAALAAVATGSLIG